MAKKILSDIILGNTWNGYIACVEAVLKKAGLWDEPIWMLMGITGMAFHFIIEKNACPSSITVYDWNSEHMTMMDRIGIHTDNYAFGDDRYNTIEYQRNIAVSRLKESIDRGVGVVSWAPSGLLEFGVINGYDDDDGVFFLKDMSHKDADPLLYDNIGRSEVSVLYYQLFKGKTDVERSKIIRQSLAFGVSQWEKENSYNPNYASGRKGYENLINYLSREKIAGFGLSYIIVSYADSKKCLSDYLKYIAETLLELKGLDKAAKLYRNIADKYSVLCSLYPFAPQFVPGSEEIFMKSSANIPEMLKITKECLKLEEEAMCIIKKSLE
jgi:hypothetical protein